MPKIIIRLDTRSDFSYLLADETDTDCKSCIYTTGNKVSLLVKVNICNSSTRYTDSYVMVDNDTHIIMIKYAIADPSADPDSVQVLFTWINLRNTHEFAFVLQNGLVENQVVGVEKFEDGVPLSLQSQQSNNKQHYVIYVKQNPSNYFALYFRSPEGHIYYIMPTNGRLQIYRNDSITINDNVYVFRIGTYKCSNPEGSCPFERLMRKY